MGIELLKRLAEAFDGVASDPGVCAVVLTGQGRSFCAGLDLKIVPSLGEADQKRDDRYGFCPAGTGRWLKDGFLNVEQVLAAVDPRASGLLLRPQRARCDLPEHVPRDRGARARRMEALRVPVARDS